MFGEKKCLEQEVKRLEYDVDSLKRDLEKALSGKFNDLDRAYRLYCLWKEDGLEDAKAGFEAMRGSEGLYQAVVEHRAFNKRTYVPGTRPPDYNKSFLEFFSIVYGDFEGRIIQEGK